MSYKITPIEPFGVMLEAQAPHQDVKSLSIQMLKKLFAQKHLILLRGFKTFASSNDLSEYCESWGEISLWPFGKVLELTQQGKPQDHIFDHSFVPLHWDGMYRPQIPEYQIFHCLKAPLANQGGRTVFTNTAQVLNNSKEELKDLWEKVTGIYQRKMEFYHSKTISPIIEKHPFRDFQVIRYNEPISSSDTDFINPPDLQFEGLKSHEIDLFHKSLKEALYSSSHMYKHAWQQGDLLIADNLTLLHGREEFISMSPRHLQRVQVLSNPPFDNPGLESYR